MREILFRGKRLQGGNWVEGYFFKSDINERERNSGKATLIFTPDCDTFIMIPEAHNSVMVHADTVGQWTGLTDKNGKRIFEEDLITIPGSKRQGLPAPVKWSNFDARFEVCRRGFNPICLDGDEGIYEVIGNIHDNYEFLEGE
ncbi:MAG: hypothetical protein J6J18_11945 [Oscillospiraceae bacterium]|nr:hypothetical protein [Oscillospiraceae bacterium]